MVEIKLESLRDGSMPKDCYVSVRVGEVQKLSRLSGIRAYKFPQIGDKRFGKIEVFRRIGACSIDLEPPSHAESREVNINCEEAGFGDLGLKVNVASEAVAAAEKGAVLQPEKPGAGKVKAAKEYLSKHSLEVRLSEAMQAVLREKPDDPAMFIAARLTNGRVGAAGPSGPAAPVPPLGRGSGPVVMPPRVGAGAPAAQALMQNRPPRLAAVVPMTNYYRKHFHTVEAKMMAKLYARFPAAPRATFPLQTAKVSGPLKVLPFHAYYQNCFPGATLDLVHRRFPAEPGRPKPLFAATQGSGTSVPAPLVRFKPSVGTWYMSKICPVNLGTGAKPAAQKKPADFRKRPSVGTWLAPCPCNEAEMESEEQAREVVPFHKKPSVGTWVAHIPQSEAIKKGASPAKPDQGKQPRSFELLPSAGTWLAPQRPAPELPKVQAFRMLKGLSPPAKMSQDELAEAERVVSGVLLELTGELQGDYFPLPSSTSYPLRAGMTPEEALTLKRRNLLFEAGSSCPSGRGVFATTACDAGVWLNQANHVHVRFIVLQNGSTGARKLDMLQKAVSEALRQEGYELQ